MDCYDLDSLSRALGTFEQRYGLSSEDFFRGHRHDGISVREIPGFDRHLWASFYLDVQRMTGSGTMSSEAIGEFGRSPEVV